MITIDVMLAKRKMTSGELAEKSWNNSCESFNIKNK